jgi:alanine racemase
MNCCDQFSNWVEIDLSAIEANARCLRYLAGSEVMAVVKANAYGHGAVRAARAALLGGARYLGVARLEEALELRQAGLDCPALILGYTPLARLEEAIIRQISLAFWDQEQLEAIKAAAERAGKPARLHLKVDTGMSRLGVGVEGALNLAYQAACAPGVIYEGLFTHFARADEPEAAATAEQEGLFLTLVDQLAGAGLRPPLVHAANSAAALSRPSASLDMVRTGISLYGLHPSPDCLNPPALRPALAWKSVLSQVKTLPPGRGVCYGHEYVTRSTERIGTVPVGYADGFRRAKGNTVLVGGQPLPVVGRVCMDQIAVQLDRVPDAKPGDEVVIIGSQGEGRLTADDVARTWGTINYEVVCAIGSRVPRIYL